jgi:hypothetical protein
MNVYVWIKHRVHPEPDGQGTQQGDIVCILPIQKAHGKAMQQAHFPLVMDLNIPCGPDIFKINGNPLWNCSTCEYFEQNTCDVQKFTRSVYEMLFTEKFPDGVEKLQKKRRYRIDIDSILSVEEKTLVMKKDKTKAEEDLIVANAKSNPQLKTIIEDKTIG